MLRALFDDAGSASEAEENTVKALVRGAEQLARAVGLDADEVRAGRLAALRGGASDAPLLSEGLSAEIDAFVKLDVAPEERARVAAHRIGELLDALFAARMDAEGRAPGQHAKRRREGSFFTPRGLAASVSKDALGPLIAASEPSELSICDPAAGGGAFLIECAALLAEARTTRGESPESARTEAVRQLFGVDRNPTAVGTLELALWLFAARRDFALSELSDNVACADALVGEFPGARARGFDLVIGNPPWVAFAGRSAQPLAATTRAYFRDRYRAFRGFPSLHGLFVERAAQLAPRGRIALLLPSAVSDLDGYSSARAALAETHTVLEPLREVGQDAFSGVVQPCFVLLAEARTVPATLGPEEAARPWRLSERQLRNVELSRAEVPRALSRLEALPCLPRDAFRELGFQSNRIVSERLFVRGEKPANGYTVALLEGRNVSEFQQGEPRLYLRADPSSLEKAATRLRPAEHYRAVDFVVRQTAAVTIAARHGGLAFRNSLLAGFGVGELDADLLVGLLNSALYRTLHKSRQRDARQAAFPQVKIAHLRCLPAPPEQARGLWGAVRASSKRASERGACDAALRDELDRAVGEVFGLTAGEQTEIARYLAAKG